MVGLLWWVPKEIPSLLGSGCGRGGGGEARLGGSERFWRWPEQQHASMRRGMQMSPRRQRQLRKRCCAADAAATAAAESTAATAKTAKEAAAATRRQAWMARAAARNREGEGKDGDHSDDGVVAA